VPPLVRAGTAPGRSTGADHPTGLRLGLFLLFLLATPAGLVAGTVAVAGELIPQVTDASDPVDGGRDAGAALPVESVAGLATTGLLPAASSDVSDPAAGQRSRGPRRHGRAPVAPGSAAPADARQPTWMARLRAARAGFPAFSCTTPPPQDARD
jgi:hypothetical protein